MSSWLQLQDKTSRVYARYRQSRLLKSGTWYLVAAVFQRGLNLVSVLLLTRLLTTNEYGSLSIFTSWTLVFGVTITLNVYTSIGRAKYDYDDKTFEKFTSSILTLGFVVSIISTLAISILSNKLVISIFALPKLYVLLAALSTTAELSINTTFSLWLVNYEYKKRSVMIVIIAAAKVVIPISLILAPSVLASTDKVFAAIVGVSSVNIVFGTYFFYQRMASGAKLVFLEAWKYALQYALPLIPHTLSGLILSQFDRVLIDRYIGRSEAGLYSFAYQLGEITYMVWFATNSAWVPWFFEKMTSKAYSTIRERANQYVIGFMVLSFAAILASPILVQVFAPPEFSRTRAIVPVIIGSQFFMMLYSLYANIEFYEKKTLYISIGTALSAIVNVILNIILLPIYGYEVAGWTTLIAYIVLFLFHVSIVKYKLLTPAIFSFSLILFTSLIVVIVSVVTYIALRV